MLEKAEMLKNVFTATLFSPTKHSRDHFKLFYNLSNLTISDPFFSSMFELYKIQLYMEVCNNWQRAFEDRQEEQVWTHKQTLQAKAEKTKKGDWTSEKDRSLATQ